MKSNSIQLVFLGHPVYEYICTSTIIANCHYHPCSILYFYTKFSIIFFLISKGPFSLKKNFHAWTENFPKIFSTSKFFPTKVCVGHPCTFKKIFFLRKWTLKLFIVPVNSTAVTNNYAKRSKFLIYSVNNFRLFNVHYQTYRRGRFLLEVHAAQHALCRALLQVPGTSPLLKYLQSHMTFWEIKKTNIHVRLSGTCML
jgi:hypothetical protein